MRITIDIDGLPTAATTLRGDASADFTAIASDTSAPENGGAGPDGTGAPTSGFDTPVDSGGPLQSLLNEIAAAEKVGDAPSAGEHSEGITDAGVAPDSH